ncbi:hypothetical protein FXO38_05649 [Capsicum annuum]|uniref:Uncharacterized protein n=1 Tax=Capsicum annuum TaxID=4072 RepID=A0A2G2Y8A2_CAPAN|nr:hypothetical protein FXO37_13262 [Capsicum annuum]KAF3673384.1 hypothetical protein FXO38_05649 [Capsicum annuum]PHT65996.1 hypothetical protein T459_30421 [Capsicum annuum]
MSMFIPTASRVNVAFSCDCLNNGEYWGHVFTYNVCANDTYDVIATKRYSSLMNKESLMRDDGYPDNSFQDNNVTLKVTVNCSCENKDVSKDYGLLLPIRGGQEKIWSLSHW